jgi:hypothetical protein
VTCPADGRAAGVKVDRISAALLTTFDGAQALHLNQCSNWPKRAGCAQRCLEEIESAPDGCLVRDIVARWYRGKQCVFCKRVFAEIDWLNKPAVLGADQGTRQWNDVRIEELPEVLGSCQPVCWNCHIAESFCRAHPELVTYRRSA